MTVKIDDAMWAAEIIKPHLKYGEEMTVTQIAMNIVKNSEDDEDDEE